MAAWRLWPSASEAEQIASAIELRYAWVLAAPVHPQRRGDAWEFWYPDCGGVVRLTPQPGGYPFTVSDLQGQLACEVQDRTEAIAVIGKHLQHFRSQGVRQKKS
jgi:hypothetical protein